jgi:hypothetical protein
MILPRQKDHSMEVIAYPQLSLDGHQLLGDVLGPHLKNDYIAWLDFSSGEMYQLIREGKDVREVFVTPDEFASWRHRARREDGISRHPPTLDSLKLFAQHKLLSEPAPNLV